jgi:Type II secretion system protein C
VSRRLRLLTLALGLAAGLLAAGLVRELLTERPLPAPPAPRAAPTPAPAAAAPARPPGAYEVIAAKNLFSPHRTEAPSAPVPVAGPRPLLHGVVVDGASSRAYLEDPQLKRTFGYAVGDPVGGGRLETIRVDRVVIGRADGALEVLLQDPTKPKAPPTVAVPASPAGPAAPAAAEPAPPAPPARAVGAAAPAGER